LHLCLYLRKMHQVWLFLLAFVTTSSVHAEIEAVFFFHNAYTRDTTWMFSTTLAAVEPALRQVPLYVDDSHKVEGWVYIVKVTSILQIIKQHWGKVVLYTDSDMIFYRPFAAEAEAILDGYDIVFQGPPNRHGGFSKKRINIGFMLFRCNEATFELWSAVKRRMFPAGRYVRDRCDQSEVKFFALRNSVTKWRLFPPQFWAPSYRSHHKLPLHPVVCHADDARQTFMLPRGMHRSREWKIHYILVQQCGYVNLTNTPKNTDYNTVARVAPRISPYVTYAYALVEVGAADFVVYRQDGGDPWEWRRTLWLCLTSILRHHPNAKIHVSSTTREEQNEKGAKNIEVRSMLLGGSCGWCRLPDSDELVWRQFEEKHPDSQSYERKRYTSMDEISFRLLKGGKSRCKAFIF